MTGTVSRLIISSAAAAALLTALFPTIALSQETKSFLLEEIERLQRSPFIKTSDTDNQQLAAYKEQLRLELGSAREIAENGDCTLCLYFLQKPFLYIRREENLSGEESKLRELKEFNAAWLEAAVLLETKNRELQGTLDGQQKPAVIKAMVQIAAEKSETYLGSSKKFAEIGNEAWGRAYIGNALAYMDFAILCAKTPLESSLEPVEFSPLEPNIQEVEAELVRLFRQPEAAETQALLNEANSIVDNCRLFEKAGLRESAVLEYLESCLKLGQMQQVGIEAREKIQQKLECALARLSESALDHSIGILFCRAGQHYLEVAAGDEPKDPANAAIIAEKVLPAYFEIISGGEE